MDYYEETYAKYCTSGKSSILPNFGSRISKGNNKKNNELSKNWLLRSEMYLQSV